MAHIQWKDRNNIGYKDIDAQHRGLLDLLNELIDLVDEAADPERVSEIYRRLCAYALTHFSREERYLQAAGYADLARQKEEHGTFIHKLLELDHTYDPTDPRLLTDTRQFL